MENACRCDSMSLNNTPLSHAHSPFRVVDQNGREVEWINRYLDQERVRGVADSTLRSYAHDLLHFLRWWAGAARPPPSPNKL